MPSDPEFAFDFQQPNNIVPLLPCPGTDWHRLRWASEAWREFICVANIEQHTLRYLTCQTVGYNHVEPGQLVG